MRSSPGRWMLWLALVLAVSACDGPQMPPAHLQMDGGGTRTRPADRPAVPPAEVRPLPVCVSRVWVNTDGEVIGVLLSIGGRDLLVRRSGSAPLIVTATGVAVAPF